MIGRILFVLLLFLGGVGLYWGGARESAINDRLAAEGVEANAEVTSRTTSKKRKGQRKYHVTVRFTDVKSVTHTTQVTVPKEIFDGLADVPTTRVRYVPADPNILRVNGQTTRPWIYKTFGVILVVSSFLVARMFIRRLLRARPQILVPPPPIPPPIP